VTYDFARQMEGAVEVGCRAFGGAVVEAMGGPFGGLPEKK
jgi:isocitrate dehydrogenase